MRSYRHSLKALRDIALANTLEKTPDLASISRELGAIIHRDASVLADGMADLRHRNRGFERWLLGRRGRPGVSVLVMAWPAGYTTPSHDHAGLWGIELSLYGALEVESWSRESTAQAWQLRGRDWLGPGDATWFDADVPYMHRCRNLSRHETALTLHIYGGDLDDYATYEESESEPYWQSQPQRARIAGPLRV
ncbi:cysteine dioxygenase family protein [Dyella sp.]|jgi:predicted metal-dependent enzyme (double-stranded beta helix superfamily)|uniref:cysteine dioxygenase n=1 Tax=Dyella sp. TaxID=1869338 RepID=UPI002C5E596C|nr:cysteine dioxygenase family protein [Dyella sp.]HTC27573.1 cysteine dioxygenase family protein [Dyella sp.]